MYATCAAAAMLGSVVRSSISLMVMVVKESPCAGRVILWGWHGNTVDAVAARVEHPAGAICYVRGRSHAGRRFPVLHQPCCHCCGRDPGKLLQPCCLSMLTCAHGSIQTALLAAFLVNLHGNSTTTASIPVSYRDVWTSMRLYLQDAGALQGREVRL